MGKLICTAASSPEGGSIPGLPEPTVTVSSGATQLLPALQGGTCSAILSWLDSPLLGVARGQHTISDLRHYYGYGQGAQLPKKPDQLTNASS